MELWQIIVALIQGLAEWLPISSEGLLAFYINNFVPAQKDNILTLVVWLHLGTSLAVIVRYPRIILDLISLKDRILLKRLIIATIGTAATAIPLYIILKDSIVLFQGMLLNMLVGGLLLVTALVLYLPTRVSTVDSQEIETRDVTDKEALVTGLVQGSAVLPGLSRSGVTVSSLLMQKVDKETAFRFSFLMSVPAVLGILALEIVTGDAILPNVELVDMILIEAIVFIVGLVSMEFLLRLARRVRFWKLCLVLALIAILFGIATLP
ncbi:undecaprenyl-diphosphate phosphatase [Candidatus Thorarchaeota archaeon]|nr:MAG: undecaprenyl-diphosphate phosphatase [Candidatus Thorarchaeota archaeon]